jgi:transglutaminase-like putative cysteine protease
LFVVLAIFCAAAPAAAGTSLLLQNGQTVDINGDLLFDGRTFLVPGGAPVERDAVVEVNIGVAGRAGETPWTYDAARYEKMFAKGRELGERWPNHDGVILEDLGVFRLEANGENSYAYRFAGLVLKEDGRHWATVHWYWDAARSRLAGPYGVVIHPDGTFRVATDADRKTVSPSHGAAFFNRYQVTTLTIPDVRVGDIVEYWYTTEEFRPPSPDFFFPFYMFQSTDPLAQSRVEVRVPPGKQLYFETKNMPPDRAQPALRRDPDGAQIYVWETSDMPPFDAEPSMPPLPEVVASMRATVLANWEDIFARLTEYYRTRLVASDSVKAAVAQAVGDATDVETKITRIYEFVQRKIRYISIKTDLATGFTGHPAEVTLANGYGDCTDKAILLATMLGVVGVEAHPVILHTFGGRRDMYAIPNLGGNHAIDAVWLNGRRFFLDATAETYRYPHFRLDDQGQPYVDALGRSVGFIDREPPDANVLSAEFTLNVDERGGVRGTRVTESTGGLGATMRAMLERLATPARKKQLQKEVVAFGAQAQLVGYRDENVDQFDKPLRSTLEFTADHVAKRVGGLWVVDLPQLRRRESHIDLQARTVDLRMPLAYVERSTHHVKLPPTWRVEDLPPPLKIDNKWLHFDGRYEKTADGFTLVSATVFRQTEISPADYPAYRDALVSVETFFARRAFAREVQP